MKLLDERGIALTELTVMLPTLILLWIAMVDVSRMLNNYMALTQIVREGSRFASGVSSLESSSSSFQTSDEAPLNHRLVRARVDALMKVAREEYSLNIGDGLVIETEFFGNSAHASNIAPRVETVRVRVSTQYQALFPLFDNLSISASGIAPYLIDGTAS